MCSKKVNPDDISIKLHLCVGDGEWGDEGAANECEYIDELKQQLGENTDAAWVIIDSFITELGMGFALHGSLNVGIEGWRYKHVYNFLNAEKIKGQKERSLGVLRLFLISPVDQLPPYTSKAGPEGHEPDKIKLNICWASVRDRIQSAMGMLKSISKEDVVCKKKVG